MTDNRLPVTVVSGYLGAGKSPLCNRPHELVVTNAHMGRPALPGHWGACLAPRVTAARPRTLQLEISAPFPGWRQIEDAA